MISMMIWTTCLDHVNWKLDRNALKLRMNTDQVQVEEIARKSSSSNWLTVMPLEDSGYVLTKK